jgi:hypothetical protein
MAIDGAERGSQENALAHTWGLTAGTEEAAGIFGDTKGSEQKLRNGRAHGKNWVWPS